MITVQKGDLTLKIGGISGIFKIGGFNNSRIENYPFN